MADKTISGIVTWLKGWFYDKDEITTKENALQTQINNKASQSDLNTLSSTVSGKADSVHTHSSGDVTEASALGNIGTSANASQSVINGAVDESVGSLSTSITNLADTTEWKYYITDSNYKVRYNDYRVNVDVSITGTSATTSLTTYGVSIIPSSEPDLRPKYPVSAFNHEANVLVQVKDNDTKLYRKSMTGSNLSNISIYAHLEWDRR